MQENTENIQIPYKDLPKVEKRVLWRQYMCVVNPRGKILRAISFVLLFIMIALSGICMYYISRFLLLDEPTIKKVFITGSIAMIVGLVSIQLSLKTFKGYNAWLKNEKGIIRQ